MTHSIYIHCMGEGGFGSDSLTTEAVFNKEQAEAIAGIIKFMAENKHANYWTVVVEEGEDK